jgi:beta-galactosidase/beta-glucuronidase
VKRLCLIACCVAVAALSLTAQKNIPRAEYPRPQFQRDAWLNLNGPWEFEFDDGNVGIDQGWATAAGRKFGRTITVPFCFESRLSGIGDRTFHPWIWYRRSVTIPADWKGKRVLLNFGAVDYRAQVWVNGQQVGSHEGGNLSFSFDITPALKPGENVITVRVEDPPTDRSIPRGKQYWKVESDSIFYTRTSGIWQTVWLEAAGESYIESLRITPSLNGTVRFDARLARAREGLELVATVRLKDEVPGAGSASSQSDRVSVAAMVNNPKTWSPGAPNLYDVTLELKSAGRTIDRVASYYGYRSVGIKGDRVAINGNRTYLRMVLDQGYWPESELTPPSDEAIQYDIRMTKEMGFNGARKHQKVEDPRYLYWADKLGLLVSGEMANAQEFDNVYAARFTREWVEAVERDANHPSVIIWAPINESWGVPDLAEPLQQAHLKGIYWLTHSLDDTRLVIDNEGWEHTNRTDLFAFHDYAKTGEQLYEKYKNLSRQPGSRVPDISESALAPGFSYNGAPYYLSEFGGIAFIPPGHQVPKQAWGYSGVEKTQEDALARLRGLYEGIARIPVIGGICYTQLTDVEQEVNGLLTYDRKPKFDTKAIKEINGLLR